MGSEMCIRDRKLAARAVLSADAGLLVTSMLTDGNNVTARFIDVTVTLLTSH